MCADRSSDRQTDRHTHTHTHTHRHTDMWAGRQTNTERVMHNESEARVTD